MKKYLYVFIILPAIVYIYGCSARSCTSDSDCNFYMCRFYEFTMKDSSGNNLLDGALNIEKYDDNANISGTYTIKKTYVEDFPGYSSMKGIFKGKANEKNKTAYINTNPKISDNNIIFNLKVIKDSLSGKWTYETIKGVINKGTLTGINKKK